VFNDKLKIPVDGIAGNVKRWRQHYLQAINVAIICWLDHAVCFLNAPVRMVQIRIVLQMALVLYYGR